MRNRTYKIIIAMAMALILFASGPIASFSASSQETHQNGIEGIQSIGESSTSGDKSSEEESSQDESSEEPSDPESSQDDNSKDETSKDESSQDESSQDDNSQDESSQDESSEDESSEEEKPPVLKAAVNFATLGFSPMMAMRSNSPYYPVTTCQELAEYLNQQSALPGNDPIYVEFANDIQTLNRDASTGRYGHIISNIKFTKDLYIKGNGNEYMQTNSGARLFSETPGVTLTFQDVKLSFMALYAIQLRGEGSRVVFDNVELSGPQAAGLTATGSTIEIRDNCKIDWLQRHTAYIYTFKYGPDGIAGSTSCASNYSPSALSDCFIADNVLVTGKNNTIEYKPATTTYKNVFSLATKYTSTGIASVILEPYAELTIESGLSSNILFSMQYATSRQFILGEGARFSYTGFAVRDANGYGDLDTVTVGEKATLILKHDQSTHNALTLGAGGSMTVEKDSIVDIAAHYNTGYALALNASSALTINDPKFVALEGQILANSSANVNINAQFANYWESATSTASDSPDLFILSESGQAEEIAPQLIPMTQPGRAFYGQAHFEVEEISPHEMSFSGTTEPNAAVKVMYFPNINGSPAVAYKPIETTADADGNFTVEPTLTPTTMPAEGYGPFYPEKEMYFGVYFDPPTTDAMGRSISLHAAKDRQVFLQPIEIVGKDLGRLALSMVDDLVYTGQYMGYTKKYGVNQASRLVINDTREVKQGAGVFEFVLTAQATPFQAADGQILDDSTIGVIRNGRYNPMTNEQATIVTHLDKTNGVLTDSGNGIYTLNLQENSVAENQIVVEVDPYEVAIDKTYTTMITWNLSPDL